MAKTTSYFALSVSRKILEQGEAGLEVKGHAGYCADSPEGQTSVASKKIRSWEYPRWKLCGEFNFQKCFSSGLWEQSYEEYSFKYFPPMLQSCILTRYSFTCHQLGWWRCEDKVAPGSVNCLTLAPLLMPMCREQHAIQQATVLNCFWSGLASRKGGLWLS